MKVTNSKDAGELLAVGIKAKQPLSTVTTDEERRVQSYFGEIATRLKMQVMLWSIVSGFEPLDTEGGLQADPKTKSPQQALAKIRSMRGRLIVVMRDFHPFMDPANPANIATIRTAKELAQDLRILPRDNAKMVVFLGATKVAPDELKSEIAHIDWPLPTDGELQEALVRVVAALPQKLQDNIDMSNGLPEQVVKAAKGMTLDEAQNYFARSMVTKRTLDPLIIAEGKREAVERMGSVEWVEPMCTMEQIGGLEVAKAWLTLRKLGFTQAALDYGLNTPKGFLTIGLPGTGKSMLAMAAAVLLGMPILRVSADAISGGLVGESEAKTRKVFKTAEACAPCLLMLDSYTSPSVA